MGIVALLSLAALMQAAHAADPRYQTGPARKPRCRTSRSPRWAGPPLGNAQAKWKDDAKVSALVEKVAARLVPIDEAEKAVTELLSAPGIDKVAVGKLIFAGLFEQLNAERFSEATCHAS